jgi:hypothetical protein
LTVEQSTPKSAELLYQRTKAGGAREEKTLLEYRSQFTNRQKYIQNFAEQQFLENKRLRFKLQELEDQLVKFKKFVLLDHVNYEKVLKLEGQYSLQHPGKASIVGKNESRIIQYLVGKSKKERTDYERLSKVLDLVLRTNIHLEFEVSRDENERARNEKHLIVEQREAVLRRRMVEYNCQ